jgi:hypothetical protein
MSVALPVLSRKVRHFGHQSFSTEFCNGMKKSATQFEFEGI